MKCARVGGMNIGILIITFAIAQPSFAQTFTSSNLPIVIINTNGFAIADEPKITADMGIIHNGVGVRNNLIDPQNNYNGKIGIEVRGSSSQMFPKKQYSIELRDGLGAGVAASLLGMPVEEDWVLFAPYNDKSLMRDVLAYKLARDMGRYAPRTRYCEVVLNGDYLGIYILMEKVKRDKNRVDIANLAPMKLLATISPVAISLRLINNRAVAMVDGSHLSRHPTELATNKYFINTIIHRPLILYHNRKSI